MNRSRSSRRDFLRRTAAWTAAGVVAPAILTERVRAEDANDKLLVASIGVGGRGSGVGRQASRFAQTVACCDVDSERATKFAKGYKHSVEAVGDYRRILDRKDIDCVTIGTPDHWHTKISIEAMQAGKDVYCEKPLTLTIDEGKIIRRVVDSTKKVFQVGTQQRSEFGRRFLNAVAIARSGRLGTKLKARSSVGGARSGGPFQEESPPPHLDWDMWLGQAPKVPYIKERTHYEFRWWFEYSGGQVTDWGVHHTDIAVWALGLENTGPVKVRGKGEFDERPNCYNVAKTFNCQFDYANGHQIILDSGRNMLTIEGEKGKIEVNRGTLRGEIVDAIAKDPKESARLEEEVQKLYRGMPQQGHMANFFHCVRTRELPISDVETHHRSLSVCHLGNIAMLTGRELTWDPKKEDFVGDAEASAMLKREQRKGFEIVI